MSHVVESAHALSGARRSRRPGACARADDGCAGSLARKPGGGPEGLPVDPLRRGHHPDHQVPGGPARLLHGDQAGQHHHRPHRQDPVPAQVPGSRHVRHQRVGPQGVRPGLGPAHPGHPERLRGYRGRRRQPPGAGDPALGPRTTCWRSRPGRRTGRRPSAPRSPLCAKEPPTCSSRTSSAGWSSP